MFQITIISTIQGVTYKFFYKDEATMKKALQNLQDLRKDNSAAMATVKDDFDHIGYIRVPEIAGVVTIDVAKDTECNIELAVLNQRAQKKAQERVANDPVLKLSGSSLHLPSN